MRKLIITPAQRASPSPPKYQAISRPSRSPTASTSQPGDVIARIDDRDYRIALAQAQDQMAVAQANIEDIDARIVGYHAFVPH